MKTRTNDSGWGAGLANGPTGVGIPAVFVAVLLAASAAGLTINLTDLGDPPMTAQQFGVIRRAADNWEGQFSDPVTVNIGIAFAMLDGGVMRSTLSARATHPYANVRTALIANAVSMAETVIASSLPGTSIDVTDINGYRDDNMVTMTTANAKALGLGTGLDADYPNPPTGTDAIIKFSTAYATLFDYDPDDGVPADKYDIAAMATHEIGHALGFLSVTDIQDQNPDRTLHPSPLDLYRFNEYVNLTSIVVLMEKRTITHGGASYYDMYSDVPMSHGMMDCSDLHCQSSSGCCQASHWRDDTGLLMAPTIAKGTTPVIEPQDMRTLDHLGWNKTYYIDPNSIIRIVVAWFDLNPWPDIPDIPEELEPFPPPPPPELVRLPGTANLALLAGFEFDGEDSTLRSGLGYARFESSRRISPNAVEPTAPVRGGEYLDPPGQPMSLLPQNLSEVYIQSDIEGGTPFTFRSTCGENGCPFEPGLGEYGGYRVPGMLDGQGDMQMGDVDGHITMVLLAPDAGGIPDPQGQNMFVTSSDMTDNSVLIFDRVAMNGIIGPICGDGDHPIVQADFDGNCIVNLADFRVFAEQWLLCNAPKCP